jgi:hypothetical protein
MVPPDDLVCSVTDGGPPDVAEVAVFGSLQQWMTQQTIVVVSVFSSSSETAKYVEVCLQTALWWLYDMWRVLVVVAHGVFGWATSSVYGGVVKVESWGLIV